MRPPRPLVIIALIVLTTSSIALAMLASIVRATPIARLDPTAIGPLDAAPTQSGVAPTLAPATETQPDATAEARPVVVEPVAAATEQAPAATPEQPAAQLGLPPIPTATQSVAGGLPIGAAPLTVEMHAASQRVAPGGDMQFQLTVRSATTPAVVQTRSFLSGPADVVAVQASGGSCTTGNPVVCEWALSDHAGTATIVARVSPNTAAGTAITIQTVAQDSSEYTAASNPSVALVQPVDAAQLAPGGPAQAAAATPRIAPTDTSAPAAPAPAARPRATTASRPPATPARAAGAAAETSATATPKLAAATPAEDPALATATLELAASPTDGARTPEPAAVATAAAIPAEPGAQPAPGDTERIGLLPKTAAFSFAPALSLGLLGCAVIVLGLRRVRAADQEVRAQSRKTRHLAAIVTAICYLQRRTHAGVETMDASTRTMRERLEERERRAR